MARKIFFASDLVMQEVVKTADVAIGTTKRLLEAASEFQTRLETLFEESFAAGQNLEKQVVKSLKLNARSGKEVKFKIGCAYETACYASQAAAIIGRGMDALARETDRYVKCKPGNYVPTDLLRKRRKAKNSKAARQRARR